MKERLMGGITAPLLTPFCEDGNIDYKEYARLVLFVTDNGVHNLFVGGTTGEFVNLAADERKRLLAVACDNRSSETKVMFNVTAMNQEEMEDFCQWARQCGADAVSVTAPYYHKYDKEALIQYFCKCADLAGEIPLYLYNMPGMTTNPITPDILGRLAERCPNLGGIKDSSMDFMMILEYQEAVRGYSVEIVTGNDAQILTTLQAGGDGAVAALAGVYPELTSCIWNSFLDGKLDEAREAQNKVMDLRRLCRDVMPVMSHKYLLELRGFQMGKARFPMRDLNEREKETIRNYIKRLGL